MTLGYFFPDVFQLIGKLEIARINIPVTVLIWLMIIPMLLKIDLKELKGVKQHWRGVGVTLFVNWAIKPFSMALLAWLFVGHLFNPYLPQEQIESYIAGLIILAAAPCTAMVFVCSHLMDGEPHFTLSQVALNDLIMVIAFAPIVGLLLGLSQITVPWDTLLLSVVLYIVIPLIIAHILRTIILRHEHGYQRLADIISKLHSFSLLALLVALVLLFEFQGNQIINKPIIIVLLSIPIFIKVIFNSGLAYLLNRVVNSPHCVAGPSALIGASNILNWLLPQRLYYLVLNQGQLWRLMWESWLKCRLC